MHVNRNAAFWDKSAASYAKRPVKDEAAYETTLARTRAHLGPDDRVLELGCGTGTTALKLAAAVGDILATDISPEMIRIATAKAREAGAANVTFMAGSADDPRLDGRMFDAVIAFNLLHLVDDLAATLSRAAALIKPGGVLVTKTVCLEGHGWYLRPMIAVMQALGKAPFVRFLAVDDLERAIREAGFDIVETGNYPAKPPSRFIVARKR